MKLDKDLKQVATWGEPCTTVPNCDETHLFGPRDIHMTTDGNVLVTDTGNARIIEYTADGTFVKMWGQKADPNASPGPLDLNEPVGLAVGLNGDVYLADFWNKRIVHYDKDFNPVGQPIPVPSWGSNAVTNRPYLALTLDGHLLATDPEHGNILIFNPDGSAAGTYPVVASQSAASRPLGIADHGRQRAGRRWRGQRRPQDPAVRGPRGRQRGLT